MKKQETEKDIEYLRAVDGELQRRAPDNLMLFLRSLMIPSAMGPMRYSQCIAPYQEDAFGALAPSLHAVRDGEIPPIRRFWIERTKKAGKDSDIAACIVWLMAFPRKPLKVQVCAANSKQAGIIKNRAVEILHYNPWLLSKVEIVESQIRSKTEPRKVWTHIEATDSQGAAHGEAPDLLVLNELVHVAKWRAMEDHMANADGVPRGVVIISTNAGFKGSKAHTWRKLAFAEKERWCIKVWSKTAPWVSKEDIAEAKLRDPVGAEFSRLWEGKWISGVGGAVSEEDMDKCFVLADPMDIPERGWRYFGGLDLGVTHDHAGVVVTGVNKKSNRLRVVNLAGFAPSVPNDRGELEVDLMAVERQCLDWYRRYRLGWLGYDPAAGGSFMAQRLSKLGVPMRQVSFSSPAVQSRMATTFVQAIKEGKLECYEDPEGRLRRDFGKFSIVNKGLSGYKLEATSDEFGHADVGVALIITLPRAIEELGGFVQLQPDDDVAYSDMESLEEDEVNEMPDELKNIYLGATGTFS